MVVASWWVRLGISLEAGAVSVRVVRVRAVVRREVGYISVGLGSAVTSFIFSIVKQG